MLVLMIISTVQSDIQSSMCSMEVAVLITGQVSDILYQFQISNFFYMELRT